MKILTLFFLVFGLSTFAQPKPDSTRLLLLRARLAANPKNPMFNARKAFAAYSTLAQQGNAEAMNGLALLYRNGTGVEVNNEMALALFTKAANAGFPHAWYNLALMYKDGVSVPQDFAKAYEYYCKGADLNDANSIYGKGYMQYKGFGVAQNYEAAAALFKIAASRRDDGSCYMLGLCYKNGYGINVNADSAKIWLTKAATIYKDKRAIQELADPAPENLDLKNVPNLQPAPSAHVKPINIQEGYKQIKHHIAANDIAGDYTGYAIKFDWSGKHIISQSALTLHLERNNKTLNGSWIEDGQAPVAISGTLTDTALVFNNTLGTQADHYHKEGPIAVTFKDSHLNLVKSSDTVYLTGTLRLYSQQLKEPQKPEFMMLIRTRNKQDYIVDHRDTAHADALHFVAYPNPFVGSLQLRYTLQKAARVSITVSSVMTGAIMFRSQAVELAAGEYTNPVVFSGPAGNYIVTLQYGNKIKSAIIVKE